MESGLERLERYVPRGSVHDVALNAPSERRVENSDGSVDWAGVEGGYFGYNARAVVKFEHWYR